MVSAMVGTGDHDDVDAEGSGDHTGKIATQKDSTSSLVIQHGLLLPLLL